MNYQHYNKLKRGTNMNPPQCTLLVDAKILKKQLDALIKENPDGINDTLYGLEEFLSLLLHSLKHHQIVEIKKAPYKSKCETCQNARALKPHTCPYLSEIKRDCDTLCNCCKDCQRQCYQEP